jgi:hypothetical protein
LSAPRHMGGDLLTFIESERGLTTTSCEPLMADRHVWGRQAAGGTTTWQPNSRTSSEGRRAYPAAPPVLPS